MKMSKEEVQEGNGFHVACMTTKAHEHPGNGGYDAHIFRIPYAMIVKCIEQGASVSEKIYRELLEQKGGITPNMKLQSIFASPVAYVHLLSYFIMRKPIDPWQFLGFANLATFLDIEEEFGITVENTAGYEEKALRDDHIFYLINLTHVNSFHGSIIKAHCETFDKLPQGKFSYEFEQEAYYFVFSENQGERHDF